MKRIIILICVISLFLLGCANSHPEGWKSGNLKDYITNYSEVEDALKEVFNTNDISIKQCDDKCSDIDTLSNFGNGSFYIVSNDIEFNVICKDKIATTLYYNNGAGQAIVYTKTEQENRNNINLGIGNTATEIGNKISKTTNDLLSDVTK